MHKPLDPSGPTITRRHHLAWLAGAGGGSLRFPGTGHGEVHWQARLMEPSRDLLPGGLA